MHSVDGEGERSAALEHDTAAVRDGTVRGRGQGVLVIHLQAGGLQCLTDR
jgi:hypothetical protein